MKHFYLIFLLALTLFLSACRQRKYSSPGPPLIYISFDNAITNAGVLPVKFEGSQNVSYDRGISDSCFNLTKTARFREPLIFDKGPRNTFSDYQRLSVMVWVKASPEDPHFYEILSQKKKTSREETKGWHITKTKTGSWLWEFSNGDQKMKYAPPHTHQPIDDGNWHLIGFTINTRRDEARFYYDGELKAVYSTEDFEMKFPETPVFIGTNSLSKAPRKDAFNGMIDELGIWSRALSMEQVAGLYKETKGESLEPLPEYKDSITIMTWNICNGGTRLGKHVGVQMVAEIIKNTGADIIALQEAMEAGKTIADKLDFYYYRRSANLCVLSRFPLVKSYNAFSPSHLGLVNINIGKGREISIGPLWLSEQPNLSAYFKKENARSDTLELKEMETRGKEANFILSEIRPFINNSHKVPVVLAGNFNSGSHLDWTKRNKERYNGMVVDFPATRLMESSGLEDAFRQIWPDETKTPGNTWSPIYNEGLQMRMDFIYYSGAQLKPVWTDVVDTFQYGFPSDHAAVVVSFSVNEP